jgi:hypothetical protein
MRSPELSDYIFDVNEFNHPGKLKLLIAIISTISQVVLTWKNVPLVRGVAGAGENCCGCHWRLSPKYMFYTRRLSFCTQTVLNHSAKYNKVQQTSPIFLNSKSSIWHRSCHCYFRTSHELATLLDPIHWLGDFTQRTQKKNPRIRSHINSNLPFSPC